ncbi:MAG: hypothetical protein Q8Q49_05150 [bacterium]|nr:hypothetical protein [bacterium]
MENTESSTQSSSTPPSGLPKIVIILIVLVLLIGAGIGGYIVFGKNLMKQQLPTSTEKTAVAVPSPTPGSIVTSIREALAGSQSLQCDFTDEEGRAIMSYIKSGAVRTDITATDPKQSTSVIMKDKKVYYWNGKTGTVMTFDLEEMMQGVTPPQTTPSVTAKENPQDVVAAMEKYKESCKEATVDDSMFIPPADVKFTDVSSMMKSVKSVPSAIPSGITEEQIKAMQEAVQQ